MLKTEDIEEIRNYFKPKTEKGTALPNPKSVPDDTEFLQLESNNTYSLHRMINGAWHIGKVNASDEIYFIKE